MVGWGGVVWVGWAGWGGLGWAGVMSGGLWWGGTYVMFYCFSLILRRNDMCLLKSQGLISYY